MCRSFPMIRKPKEDPQESRLDVKGTLSAVLGDRNILIEDLDAHLNKLRQQNYSETQIEEFRLRLNVGGGEPS